MMPRAQAEQDAGGRQRDRFMTEPEDMKLWTNDLNQRAKAKSLHPFLLESAHGDGATDEQEAAYAQQVTMAKRMLRKEKYSADEMKMSTNEGQALVNTQMEMMDSQAIQLITDYCTAEQRTYLLDFQKASGKFAAMQSFFGGETHERRLYIKEKLRILNYKPASKGQGMRNLVKEVSGLRDSLRAAGGTLSDEDVLQTIISKACGRGGEGPFAIHRTLLLRDLSDGTLTFVKLRSTLVQAEMDAEIQADDSSDDETETVAGSAQVTRKRSTRELLELVMTQQQQQQQLLQVMVTSGLGGGGRGGGRGGDRRGFRSQAPAGCPTGTCWQYFLNKECSFGKNCRFKHDARKD
jgi:hypothetical protein